MKLHILSDLHNSHMKQFVIPKTDADMIILAGDIGIGDSGMKWAIKEGKRLQKPIVYVPGNHEFYSHSVDTLIAKLKDMDNFSRSWSENPYVTFLYNDSFTHITSNNEQVRFLGTTLWTNFIYFNSEVQAKYAAARMLNDYRFIENRGQLITPEATQGFNQEAVSFLTRNLTSDKSFKKVVITHHGASPQCHNVARHGAANDVALSFWSDFEDLIQPTTSNLWVYGHTHSNLRFEVNGVRVVCNQKGYSGEGVSDFNPEYVVEI